MNWTNETLRDFGWNIQRILEGKDLSRSESYEMFRQVLGNRQPDLQQGAFLAALAAKPETPQEIAGAWEAILELDTNRVASKTGGPVVENSGTGMDKLKTFNVSSAAAVVAASGGVVMARHGSRALTSTCGTVDLLEEAGIDVEADVDTVSESLVHTGIGLFNGMSSKVHPQALGRILSQIRFGSILNIAASLASPCRATHALRGVHSPAAVKKVAEVMSEIGFQKAMIVHGFDREKEKGMDEISILGETMVREVADGKPAGDYSFFPEDIGLERVSYEDIATSGDVRKEAVRFLQVIAGTGSKACRDFTCLNAGAVFYLTGKAEDLKQGLEKSRELIESGLALKKMVQWVRTQADEERNGLLRFLGLAERAGLKKEVAEALA